MTGFTQVPGSFFGAGSGQTYSVGSVEGDYQQTPCETEGSVGLFCLGKKLHNFTESQHSHN